MFLNCNAAAFKFRIEQNVMVIMGIKTVIIANENHNVDSILRSLTKNLEHGKIRDMNQTVAMSM